MPTVLRVGPYRFFFFSSDGGEPPHVHVERGELCAKLWLAPVRVAHPGRMTEIEVRRVRKLVEWYRAGLLRSWHEFFAS